MTGTIGVSIVRDIIRGVLREYSATYYDDVQEALEEVTRLVNEHVELGAELAAKYAALYVRFRRRFAPQCQPHEFLSWLSYHDKRENDFQTMLDWFADDYWLWNDAMYESVRAMVRDGLGLHFEELVDDQ